MANTPKNWIINGAVAGQWNSLVTDSGAVLSSVLLANTQATQATIQVRLATSAGVPITTILAAHVVDGYGAEVLSLRSLAIPSGQQLQVYVDASRFNLVVHGAL